MNTRLNDLVEKYSHDYSKYKPFIFLSGAMTGLTHEEQVGWRDDLKDEFSYKYHLFDPTQYDPQKDDDDYQKIAEEFDLSAIINSEYIVVNLKNIEKSVGTCQEVMFAWLLNKKILGVFPKKEDVKDLHYWINSKLTIQFHSIEALKTYLLLKYYKEKNNE